MSDYTILIIDYEPGGVDRIRRPLEDSGLRVEVAADGIVGARAFERFLPALTFVEIMLPKRSGLEVCLDLKQSEYGAGAPIVAMTSRFRSRKYRNEALGRFRADDFLEKPVQQEALFDLVQRHVRSFSGPKPVEELQQALSRAPSAPAPDVETEIGNHLDAILGGPPPDPAENEPTAS